MRGRSRVGTVLLATMVVIGNGLVVTAAHAQGADPATGSPADRFRLPTAADLATDAARTVIDEPTPPGDEIDLTPVIERAQQAVDALPAEDWDVAALAATLPDTDAAFSLVRDRIDFDAYRGLLRGAQGTLGARAGNAFDRAALLKSLLDAQHLTTRFAFGTLDDDTAAALVTRSLDDPAEPLPSASGSLLADAFEASMDTRARRDDALLSSALGDRLAALAADATDTARADVSHHAWLQVQQTDGSWIDLDPTMPDAQPGDTLTTATSTADRIPETETDTVGISVVAEHLQDGDLVESTALDETIPAWAAADGRIVLTFTAPGAGGMLNPGGLFGGGGGGDAWAPTLLVDYNAWEGDPIVFSGQVGGGGLLGGGVQADLASLSVDITIGVPGVEPQVVRHVLADRLTPEQRAAGGLNPDDLAPVADDDGTPAIFRSVVHVMVSTGGADPRAYALDDGFAAAFDAWAANQPDISQVPLNEIMVPLVVADQAMVVASEQRFIPAIDDPQVRAFVAEPRVYLVTRSVGVDAIDRDVILTDLVSDTLRTLPHPGAPADAAARHQLWYGALGAAFESEYALVNAGDVALDGRSIEGVSFRMGAPLSVVTGSDETVPTAADASLTDALAAGGLVVIPGDIASAGAWWEVAADGTTRSVLAPRFGAARVGGSGGGRYRVPPVNPGEKPRDQRKQQNGQGGGDEYVELVDEVGTKTTKVAEALGRNQDKFVTKAAKPLVNLTGR